MCKKILQNLGGVFFHFSKVSRSGVGVTLLTQSLLIMTCFLSPKKRNFLAFLCSYCPSSTCNLCSYSHSVCQLRHSRHPTSSQDLADSQNYSIQNPYNNASLSPFSDKTLVKFRALLELWGKELLCSREGRT